MSFWTRFASGALALGLGVALVGCSPGQSQADEEKEPHFVLGKSRVNAMDYQGAVEAFEESLEVNPRSAVAHYQLAILYDTKVPDPAAAIYHYQQYLKLDPAAPNPDVIKGRIDACKQQLAADVMPLPSTPAAQQQLEKLMEQNRQLQAQVDQLSDLVRQWSAYASQLAAARSNAPPAPDNSVAAPPVSSQPQPTQTAQTAPAAGATATRTKVARPRAHTVIVTAGETAMAICRKHGIKFNALQAANPGVNLGRIRAGQVLNLPP